MQTIEDYISYWELESHPFLLSPQPSMFYEGGQYFECLQRLRYAVKTQKGGVIIVSEEAGLGKTTLILRLIEEMKSTYGNSVKFAFVEHPTLDANQIIAYIKREITGEEPYDDKLKNLLAIREVLSDLFERGGKCVVAIDEAHMLVDSPSILQELRMLMNLTYRESYLHTFIISGQKPLWHALSQMREFWQRLPVRYYLLPLSLDETRNLINFRLKKAGCKREEIYTKEAIELIYRFSGGCPRTIIALSDLALLVGYTNLANKVGEKEVAKGIEILEGKGDALPYMEKVQRIAKPQISLKSGQRERIEHLKDKKGETPVSKGFLLILILVLLPSLFFTAYLRGKVSHLTIEAPITKEEQMVRDYKWEFLKREAVIKVKAANVRYSPSTNSERMAILMKGHRLEILDSEIDENGNRWFKIELMRKRYGWISEKVVEVEE